MTTTPRLTIEDFERLPAEQARNHELINGELVDVSGNIFDHNWLRDRLLTLLLPFVRNQRLGVVVTEQEYDFDGDAHGPDVTFFSTSKQSLVDRRKRVQRFVPDLAIEIVSGNDTFADLLRKKDRYLRCGTREVWIVSQDSREVYVYSDHGNRILTGRDELKTDLIPEFSITVAELLHDESA